MSRIELDLDLDSFLKIRTEQETEYRDRLPVLKEFEVVYLLGVEVERYEYDEDTYMCEGFDEFEFRRRAERVVRKLWAMDEEEEN